MTEPLVVTPTKCRLCNHIFPPDIFHSATLLATSPTAKAQQVQQLMAPLMKHLADAHSIPVSDLSRIDQNKNWTQFIELQVMNYRGLLLLDAFETSEPVFLEQRELARAAVHRRTRKNTVSDERLKERLAETFKHHYEPVYDSDLYDATLALLKSLRDVLEERTPHPVQVVK